MARAFDSLASRARLEESGCLVWQGSTTGHSGHIYGVVQRAKKRIYVHRLAWVESTGREIPEGMKINHKCGVTLCINPEHLELSTNAENIRYRTVLNKNNSSGYRNVHRNPRGGWQVVVKLNGQTHYLGYFQDAAKASRVAEEFRKRHFEKEFSDWKGR